MADDDNERPQYQSGVGTINGTQFHWGSGTPGKYWSIPYGDYPVTPNAPTGAWAHQVGAIPIANNVIPDPLLGRNRIGIMIHSGSAPSLDQLYTEGCFKVDPQDWPNVRSQILAEANKGPLYLHVAPGGVAAFTNTKTFSQAGDETPAANANAAANTTAAPAVASGPSRPVTPTPGTTLNTSPMDLVANVESGNRNIAQQIHDKNTDAGTPAGGFFQIIDPTWRTYAAKAGVDLNQYPTAMSAPRNIQAQVASAIPVNQWGPTTVAALKKQYPGIDTSQTLGQVQTAALGGSAPSASPASPASLTGALAGLGSAKSSPLAQNLDQFDKALTGRGFLNNDQQQGGQAQPDMRPAPIMQGPGLRNYPGPAGVEAQARQLEPQLTGYSPGVYGQALNSQPLAWSNAPIGAPAWLKNAGPQQAQGLGTSLNSLQAMDPQMYADRMAMLYGTGGSFGGGGYG